MAFGDVILLLSGPYSRSGEDMQPLHKAVTGVTQQLTPARRYNVEYTTNGTPRDAFVVKAIWATHSLSGGWGVQMDVEFYTDGFYIYVRNGTNYLVNRIYSDFGTSIKYVLGRYVSTTPAVSIYFWVAIDGSKLNPSGSISQIITYNIYDSRDAGTLASEFCTGAVTFAGPVVGSQWWPCSYFPKGGLDLITTYGGRTMPTGVTFGFVVGGTPGAYYIDVTMYNPAAVSFTQRINLNTTYVDYVFVAPADKSYGVVFKVDSALLAEQINPTFSGGTDMRSTYAGGVTMVPTDTRYSPPMYSEYYPVVVVDFLYYLYNTKAYDVPVTVSYLTSLDGSVLTGYTGAGDNDGWWFYTATTTDPNLTAELSTTGYVLIDTSTDTGTFTIPANSYAKVQHRMRLGNVPPNGTTGLSGFRLL